MDNLLISVIIPIYKCELYIERCARSLMEQTMVDGIEFLFINDATPDESMTILQKVIEEYPNRKGQVRIIENSENLGVSATRKKGLKLANGEYVGWCDSDDWVEPDAFEKMYAGTNNGKIDIVICPFWEGKEDQVVVHFNECASPQECIMKSWQGYYLPGSLWQQISRKRTMRHCMNMITETNYSEDVFVLYLVYYMSQSISYMSEPYYHYNVNESSLSHNIDCSWDAWLIQRKNIDIIQKELYKNGGKRKYRVACNALKNMMKRKYRNAFPNILSYYFSYRECYLDVNKYFFTPKGQKFKTFLVHNMFLLFWLKYRKNWKL